MAVYSQILAAVDLGPDSEALVRRALAVTRAFGGRLGLAHVVEYVMAEPAGEVLVPPPLSLEPELARSAENRLAALAESADAADAARHVAVGSISAELDRLVEETQADLLITGAHERHGFAMFVGHTERSLLRHTACDVLVVRL